MDLEVGRQRGTEASPVTGEYPVAPFRKAFERSGMSLTELARRLDYWRPDQPRAGRLLGYHRDHGYYHEQLQAKTAFALLDVLDVDPIDVGL